MIERLLELNRLLSGVKTLANQKGIAKKSAVILWCKGFVLEGRMPDHEQTIDFCSMLGLLEHKRGDLRLTTNGAVFLQLNNTNFYDLCDEQKRFLIRKCYLDGSLRKKTLKCLKEFAVRS